MLCHAYHSWILWVNVYSAMTKAASWHKSSVPTAFCWSRRSRKVRTKPGALSLSRLSRVTALWSRDLWGEIPKSSSKFCQAGSLLLQAANLFLLVQGSAFRKTWGVWDAPKSIGVFGLPVAAGCGRGTKHPWECPARAGSGTPKLCWTDYPISIRLEPSYTRNWNSTSLSFPQLSEAIKLWTKKFMTWSTWMKTTRILKQSGWPPSVTCRTPCKEVKGCFISCEQKILGYLDLFDTSKKITLHNLARQRLAQNICCGRWLGI